MSSNRLCLGLRQAVRRPRPQIHNPAILFQPPMPARATQTHDRRSARQHSPSDRANDAQYCRDWRIKNPDYWKNYRATHPEYAERNRIQQRQRNKARKNSDIANEDVWPAHAFIGGLYRLYTRHAAK